MADENENLTAEIHVKVTPAQREKWERHAKAERRTLSSWLRWIVEKLLSGEKG